MSCSTIYVVKYGRVTLLGKIQLLSLANCLTIETDGLDAIHDLNHRDWRAIGPIYPAQGFDPSGRPAVESADCSLLAVKKNKKSIPLRILAPDSEDLVKGQLPSILSVGVEKQYPSIHVWASWTKILFKHLLHLLV